VSAARVGALVRQEAWHGSRSVLLVWALAAPVAITLMINLVFGSILAPAPRLGIVDAGGSALTAVAGADEALRTRVYADVDALRVAVEAGSVDMGIVLPAGFDDALATGLPTAVQTFVWGQSLASDRAVLIAAVTAMAGQVAGRDPGVVLAPEVVGEAPALSLRQRLLPMVVLMAVFLGGLFLPATSLVREKEHDTLRALFVTPLTLGELLTAKGIFGWMLSLFMGVAILVLNGALGAGPALLVGVLALGAVMAAGLGLLLGVLLKDVTSLFAVWKSGGIVLFGPAIVYLFPAIPEWVSRLFPTDYFIRPVVAVGMEGAGLGAVWVDLLVLAALDVALLAGVWAIRGRALRYAA
jgi:ABC-2 type transport system permease protein